jgi:hypothetical protein
MVACPKCQADLREWSETSVALKRFQENPRVAYVRLTIGRDCCPACQEVEGAYEKDKAPHLPVDGCSHPNGCRCFYQPFLTDLYP